MKKALEHYARAALVVVLAMAVGMFGGRFVAENWPAAAADWVRPAAFVLGTGMLLVSAIGRLGWEHQTWSGESPAEKADQFIFWTLSVGGTLLLVLDFALGKYAK